MAAVAEVNGNGVPESAAPPIDVQVLVDHLTRLLQATLEATDDDLHRPESIFGSVLGDQTLQRCASFAQEAQAASLYIQKLLLYPSSQDDGSSPNGNALPSRVFSADRSDKHAYRLLSEPEYGSNCVACVAIMKDAQPIDTSRQISSQVRYMSLPVAGGEGESGRFEGYHTMVRLGFIPAFDASVRTKDGGASSLVKEGVSVLLVVSTKSKRSWLSWKTTSSSSRPTRTSPYPSFISTPQSKAYWTKPKARGCPRRWICSTGHCWTTTTSCCSYNKPSTSGSRRYTQRPKPQIESRPGKVPCPRSSSGSTWTRCWKASNGNSPPKASSLTLEVLRHAKRFTATVSFSNDTELRRKMEIVTSYNILMRDFPLNELLTATSLSSVADALNEIFNHLNKKLRLCSYPIRRALPLVEAVSGDFNELLHKLLNGRTLMHLDWSSFQAVMAEAERTFRAWDESAKEPSPTRCPRRDEKTQLEKFIPIKINARHLETQARLKYITNFRNNHEQLQRTIVNVLGPSSLGGDEGSSTVLVDELGDVDAVEEVTQAYVSLKDVDVLDVSEKGTQVWTAAEAGYNDRTSRVENSIIARLRDRLGTTKNANDMFRIFSKFNALFVRPKIRSAVSEYQTQLIESVKRDIQALHDRFKLQYGHSEAYAMSQLRDLPPVAGSIVWARQIERHLDNYMRKVEDILGPDWHLHAEGEKLQAESKYFRKKLETKQVFDAWYNGVVRKNISISGRLFRINKSRATGNSFELAVNFDGEVIALFKEVRNLRWLRFPIPHAISNVSKDAKHVYPFAVGLMETVHQFTQTSRSIAEMSNVSILLDGYRNEAFHLVAKGVPLKWESFVDVYDLHSRTSLGAGGSGRPEAGSRHVQFVRDFSGAISILQRKTSLLSEINAKVQTALKALENCQYSSKDFRQHIDAIQNEVDQLNLEEYSNLQFWVDAMNQHIEAILASRLREAIQDWVEAFDNSEPFNEEEASESRREHDTPASKVDVKRLTHEIAIRNQTIYLRPPLEMAQSIWLLQLQAWIGVVGLLPKIEASRYDMTLARRAEVVVPTFSYLPDQCARSVAEAHQAINRKILQVSQYVEKWLQFQALWDLRREQVFDELQEDLTMWLQLLQEIIHARSTFDTSERIRSFGNIVVNYDQVQVKVNAQYDQWQHDIVAKFAILLAGRKNMVFSEIQHARKDLEGQHLEASSTQQAVTFITIVQQCKRKVKGWEREVETLPSGRNHPRTAA